MYCSLFLMNRKHLAKTYRPIIMWMLSGSSPLKNFLLRLIPSKSTRTLRVTSKPESGTTFKEG